MFCKIKSCDFVARNREIEEEIYSNEERHTSKGLSLGRI